MENAAKALVIAGGVLLAIITVSLFVYMTTATSRMAQAQDEKIILEQLVAFNNEYEAYNKRVMYGTDLITVANKAINYNKSLEPIDSDKDIQIIIKTKQIFEATKQTIIVDGSDNIVYDSGIQTDTGDSLPKDESGYVINYSTDNTSTIIKFFEQEAGLEVIPSNITYDGKSCLQKIIKYSALSNLKRAIFTCPENGVVYDENGRIESMTFEQKNIIN